MQIFRFTLLILFLEGVMLLTVAFNDPVTVSIFLQTESV